MKTTPASGQKVPSLSFCIVMDLIGSASFLLPFFGELTDIVWAPTSAIIFFFCFGRRRFGTQGAVFAFIEEILPGLDFIPTFTIAWCLRRIHLPNIWRLPASAQSGSRIN